MNKLAFTFLLLIATNTSAQNYAVVDASKKTSVLFDYNDPQSFMSLLHWNRNYIGYFDPVFMQDVDVQNLTKSQRAELIEFIGQPGTIPVIDGDPESENFGENLIVTDESGMQYFVYEAPDTMYADLKGISRIILEYTEGESPIIDRVTQVTFCKKYADEYVPVLRFFDNSILKMDGFQFFEEIETADLLTDKKLPEMSYWQELEDSVVRAGEDYAINLDYFPSTSVFSLWVGIENLPKVYDMHNEMQNVYKTYIEDSERIPFDFWYGESLMDNLSFLDVIKEDFDSVSYGMLQENIPLLDEDPNSPNYGEILLVENSDGLVSMVYPEPEPFFKWVDFYPTRSYSISSIVYDENGMQSVLEKLIFTKEDSKGEHVVLVHDPTEYWRNLVKMDLAPQKDWNAWFKSYVSILEKGKTYSGDSEKDRKAMNVSESFWYR